MARTGLVVLSCAVTFAATLQGQAPPANERDQRQRSLLALPVALEPGPDHLQRGDFAAAVAVLEKQLPYIDGNRRYLAALRDAYRGHVRQLEQAGKADEAKKYKGFLDILDPPTRASATTAPATPAASAPREP